MNKQRKQRKQRSKIIWLIIISLLNLTTIISAVDGLLNLRLIDKAFKIPIFYIWMTFEEIFPYTGILALILSIIGYISIRKSEKSSKIKKILIANILLPAAIFIISIIMGLLYALPFILGEALR